MSEFTQTTQRVSPGSPLTWRWPENTGQQGDSESLATSVLQKCDFICDILMKNSEADEISQITADEEIMI